jgi:hypothetical protein
MVRTAEEHLTSDSKLETLDFKLVMSLLAEAKASSEVLSFACASEACCWARTTAAAFSDSSAS